MVLVFHHVIIFFLLSDWLIQILPPFWFCCDVACFCFGSETQLKCTYRRCCQFFKNIVLCLDVLSGRESASMATFFFMTLLLFSRMLSWAKKPVIEKARRETWQSYREAISWGDPPDTSTDRSRDCWAEQNCRGQSCCGERTRREWVFYLFPHPQVSTGAAPGIGRSHPWASSWVYALPGCKGLEAFCSVTVVLWHWLNLIALSMQKFSWKITFWES